MFSIPVLFAGPLYAGTLSAESGFISSNLKGNYRRQTGYYRWKNRKTGLVYKLNYNDTFSINDRTSFRLGITSGNTKDEFLKLEGNTPFNRLSKSFDIEELSLGLRDFPFNGFSMNFGKLLFNAPPLISDYLWGGRFMYMFNKNLSIQWNQIAGYEGKYLLFGTRAEDDVDVFGPQIRYIINGKQLSVGFLRISDARGEKPGRNINNVLLSLKDKGLDLYGLLQNGKVSGCLDYKFNNLSFLSGYSQKGITSYGFREFERDIGSVYKPTFSDTFFIRSSFSFNVGKLRLEPSYLYLQSTKGKPIGSELTLDTSYPFFGGNLFLDASKGTSGSYVFYTGYRFNLENQEIPYISKPYEQSFYFNTWGEYLNPPEVYYQPQNGYEGWESAEHIGFWHSTFKYDFRYSGFHLKVSTGRNSKINYVVFGNTADDLKYQRNHGKLWHFESLNYNVGNLRLGLQDVKLNGFVNENLAGIDLLKPFKIGYFWEQHGITKRGSDRINYIVSGIDYRSFSFNYMYRTNRSEFNQIYSAYYNSRPVRCGYTREYGSNLRNAWSSSIDLSKEFQTFNFDILDAVFSRKFTTFGLREFFRNIGFIYKPTESNLRLLKLSISRNLPFKLKPNLSISYLKLKKFNGSSIGEEGDVKLMFEPFKGSKLSLVYALANNSSDYKGLAFSIRW